MATRMQQRRGTAATWTSANPILGVGEIGYETDTNKFKIGDGSNRWVNLTYFVDANSILDGAPGVLNTLNELAAALGDDPAFFTTVATNLSNHEADTTNVHGIANTSLLVTTTGTQTLTNKTITSPSGLVKADVGLGNVDNTSDVNKPVSTAQAAADTAVANAAASDATSKANAALASANTYTDGKVADLINSAPGALDTLNELAAAIGNDADYASTITNSLALKAPLASPTFTGTVSGVTKSMVGLGNVDNTSDANKPVSTAAQTALDLKAPLASPALTGTPTAPTAALGTNTTQVATTAFVDAAIEALASRNLVLDGGGV